MILVQDWSVRQENRLTKLAQQADVLVFSPRTATKLLKLNHHKITQVHSLIHGNQES
jgi:predicted RNA-binding protein Jag